LSKSILSDVGTLNLKSLTVYLTPEYIIIDNKYLAEHFINVMNLLSKFQAIQSKICSSS